MYEASVRKPIVAALHRTDCCGESRKLQGNLCRSNRGKPHEIIFTSAGRNPTILLYWGMPGKQKKSKHIITTAIEHHGVLNPCRQLEREGFDVTYLSPIPKG
jgi:cysteine desulfurase